MTEIGAWVRLGPAARTNGERDLRGTFIQRPHRFAAAVRLTDGRVVSAHVANPGRLTGVVSPGCTVALDGPFPPPRSLAYNMLASRVGSAWVGTVTTYANRIFPLLLAAGVFPELWQPSAGEGARVGPVEDLRHEVPHGRSRFDFQLGERFIEVKSVSLAERRAGFFPDAVSARAARHCNELGALAAGGHATTIVFVAQRGDIESVAPADTIDPEFGRALRAAARAGVLVLACALRMQPRGATAVRRVPVLL